MKKALLVFSILLTLFFFGCENSINSKKTDIPDTKNDSEPADQDIQEEDADVPETVEDADEPEIADEDGSPDTNADEDIPETSDDTDTEEAEPVCDPAYDPVFCYGDYYVNTIDVAAGNNGSPRQFRIFEPIDAQGKIPVIHFLHGFTYKLDFYDRFLMQLASHGFIVVSSQSEHKVVKGDTTSKEAEKVADFINWLKENLKTYITATPDFDNLGVSGHSRGGKVTNRLLNSNPTLAKSFFGVDPVDSDLPIPGFISDDDPESLHEPVQFQGESMFLGTEKGPKNKLNGDTAACAPKGDNSVNFYAAYPSPSHHIIAAGVGHADMVDPEDVKSCGLSCSLCAESGDSGMNMMFISYTGGLMTAFFNSTLKGQTEYENLLNDPKDAYPFTTTLIEHK